MTDVNSIFGTTPSIWVCPICGAPNQTTATRCGKCNTDLNPSTATSYTGGAHNSSNNGAENTLSTIAKILFILGLLCTFIMLLAGITMLGKNGMQEMGPPLIIMALMVGTSTLMSWAFMKVIANMSITLKEISAKIK